MNALAPLVLALALAAFTPPARAAAPPLIRVETGAHQAFINRMAPLGADSVLTISDDQTARTWTLRGRALAVVRGQAGPRDEGALYALAMSTRYVALGGRAGMSDGATFVRLLDRKTLRPAGLLSPLPDVVTALAFSADGQRLAVGFDRMGVRVYDLGQGAPAAERAGPGGAITDLVFTPDGRLVIGADGGVAVLDADYRASRALPLEAGFRPWRAALSPDGRILALGGRDAPQAALVDLATLSARTIVLAHDGGAAPAAAWSRDGTSVAFGGRDASGGVLWRLGRDGAILATAASGGAAVTALSTAERGVLFADADGGWGLWPVAAAPTYASRPAKLNFRAMNAAPLSVTPDGTRVALSDNGRPFAVLDLSQRQVQRAQTAPPARVPDEPAPPRDLQRAEKVLSSAREGRGWIVGTNFYVRRLDSTGRTLWKSPASGPVWGVAVAASARLAVVALGDGTLSWLDLDTGESQLGAFVSPTLEWAAWTPDGFFDRSAVGGRLIGHNLDRGARAGSDFIDLERTAIAYFRSDLVQAALRRAKGDRETLTRARASIGSAAVRIAASAPPRLHVEALCGFDPVADRTTACFQKDNVAAPVAWSRLITKHQVDVAIAIEEAKGGKTQLKVDGVQRIPQGEQTIQGGGVERRRFRVDLPAGDPKIEISVANADGSARSETITLQVRGVPSDAGQRRPALHVLAIGVADYQLANFDLGEGVASNDARSLAARLSAAGNQAFERRDAKVLTDSQATGSAIRAGLAALVARSEPQDVAIIFFSGHGLQVDGDYVFAPYELGYSSSAAVAAKARAGEAFPEQLMSQIFRADGVSQSELGAALANLKAARALVILDTCFGGSFDALATTQRNGMNTALGERFAESSGRYVLASARGFALDDPEGKTRNSVFTEALLRALSGGADQDHDGAVTFAELADYVRRELPRRTAALGAEQQPVIGFFGDPYFPLIKSAP